MKKVLKNKKAFTLTEMIVVIAIIGILAGVLIPTITGYIKRANQSAAYQKAEAVLNVYETWETESESGLTNYTYFADYYKEISNEVLSDNYYIEYASAVHDEKKIENVKAIILVEGKITVRIDLSTKSESFLDVNPIPENAADLATSKYDYLKSVMYE